LSIWRWFAMPEVYEFLEAKRIKYAIRLPDALAYNLGNFLRTLATPEPIKDWSLTSLKDKLIKIGAKVVSHGRYVIFQMAEVATIVCLARGPGKREHWYRFGIHLENLGLAADQRRDPFVARIDIYSELGVASLRRCKRERT
jgi:hypothetical protein